VRVYLDTGVFVDYLLYRCSIVNSYLRKRGRRNRTIQTLSNDVTVCLSKIGSNTHSAFTSAITFLEVEEIIFDRLKKARTQSSTPIPHYMMHLITEARTSLFQIDGVIATYGISIAEYNRDVIDGVKAAQQLMQQKIQSRDAIHIITAMKENADLIISTDNDILNLHNKIQNDNGNNIRCLDTDQAKRIL